MSSTPLSPELNKHTLSESRKKPDPEFASLDAKSNFLIICITRMLPGLAMILFLLQMSLTGLSARPLYKKVFIKIYPTLETQANFEGCYLCHNHPLKKLNTYGKAIQSQMPETDMQDEQRLRLYILKAAGYDSEVAGKTFGDFIKAGELPSRGCNVCTLE